MKNEQKENLQDRKYLSQHQLFLSILWMVVAVLQMVGAILTFFASGTLEHIMQGSVGNTQITAAFLYILTFTSTVPVIMAYLVIAIKNKTVNRWLSFAISIIIATMGWIDFVGQISFFKTVSDVIMYVIIVIPANIFSTMLIWHSWKWPKTKE